jgi:CubicO group peptidase (beta-lactamase class C family)
VAVLYTPHPSGKGFIPMPIPGFLDAEPPAFASGGQGLVTTLDDYLTFAQMLLRRGDVNGKRLLQPETVDLMTRNHLTGEQRKLPAFMGLPLWHSQGYGLSVSMIMNEQAHAMMGAGSVGAFGWPGLFGGWWQADPKNDLIAIWLQQTMPGAPTPGEPISATLTKMPGAMAQLGFQKRVYAALKP